LKNKPVSIIVVSYNCEKYISQCIKSLLESDYPDFEIIVIDNASTDNTKKELKKFQKINLIESKENLFFTGANNIGIKKAKGDIIVLVNPDAYVRKDTISQLVKPIIDSEKVMITGPKIYYPNTTKIQSAGGIIQKNGLTNHIGYQEEDNQQHDVQKNVDYITGAIMAIRKKFFEIAGLLDPIYQPAYYEETEKCVQAKKLGFSVLYVPTSIGFHYESTSLGLLTKRYLNNFHTSRFKFIYRNFGFKDFVQKFIPAELKWFFYYCPTSEKKIVLKAHLKTIISLYKIINKKSPSL